MVQLAETKDEATFQPSKKRQLTLCKRLIDTAARCFEMSTYSSIYYLAHLVPASATIFTVSMFISIVLEAQRVEQPQPIVVDNTISPRHQTTPAQMDDTDNLNSFSLGIHRRSRECSADEANQSPVEPSPPPPHLTTWPYRSPLSRQFSIFSKCASISDLFTSVGPTAIDDLSDVSERWATVRWNSSSGSSPPDDKEQRTFSQRQLKAPMSRMSMMRSRTFNNRGLRVRNLPSLQSIQSIEDYRAFFSSSCEMSCVDPVQKSPATDFVVFRPEEVEKGLRCFINQRVMLLLKLWSKNHAFYINCVTESPDCYISPELAAGMQEEQTVFARCLDDLLHGRICDDVLYQDAPESPFISASEPVASHATANTPISLQSSSVCSLSLQRDEKQVSNWSAQVPETTMSLLKWSAVDPTNPVSVCDDVDGSISHHRKALTESSIHNHTIELDHTLPVDAISFRKTNEDHPGCAFCESSSSSDFTCDDADDLECLNDRSDNSYEVYEGEIDVAEASRGTRTNSQRDACPDDECLNPPDVATPLRLSSSRSVEPNFARRAEWERSLNLTSGYPSSKERTSRSSVSVALPRTVNTASLAPVGRPERLRCQSISISTRSDDQPTEADGYEMVGEDSSPRDKYTLYGNLSRVFGSDSPDASFETGTKGYTSAQCQIPSRRPSCLKRGPRESIRSVAFSIEPVDVFSVRSSDLNSKNGNHQGIMSILSAQSQDTIRRSRSLWLPLYYESICRLYSDVIIDEILQCISDSDANHLFLSSSWLVPAFPQLYEKLFCR